MKSWTRTGLFSVFTLAFLGLAVAIPVQSGPWYLSAAYLVCAGVTGVLAWRSRPRGATRPTPDSPAELARRAKRSGNPAVRAQAERPDPDRG